MSGPSDFQVLLFGSNDHPWPRAFLSNTLLPPTITSPKLPLNAPESFKDQNSFSPDRTSRRLLGSIATSYTAALGPTLLPHAGRLSVLYPREGVLTPFVRDVSDDGRADGRAAGHGLGLALVARIAERHGAEVSIGTSEALGGARVQVRFAAGQSRFQGI